LLRASPNRRTSFRAVSTWWRLMLLDPRITLLGHVFGGTESLLGGIYCIGINNACVVSEVQDHLFAGWLAVAVRDQIVCSAPTSSVHNSP
jgi:hypothetical protein